VSTAVSKYGEINIKYLERIDDTVKKALHEHPRTFAVRLDLRCPDVDLLDSDCPSVFFDADPSVITRFIESFKSQLKEEQNRKRRAGCRVYPCTVRYIWVREQNNSLHQHYHVVLLLNKDAYAFLGKYKSDSDTLQLKIRKAWCSALRLDFMEHGRLVHFPVNPIYYLDNNREVGVEHGYWALLYRLAYFAKVDTKLYGRNHRVFGASCR